MTAYVLIVEDEEDFVEEIRQTFNDLPGHAHVTVAASRDKAISLIGSQFFDLLVLDLRIPTVDGALDGNPEHGHAVFARARLASPGTPILVLTGSPAEDFIPSLLEQQQQVDIWGEGRKVGTVTFLQKYKFDEFPGKLGPIMAAINGLSEVELERGGANLKIEHDRLIRIFARRFGGTRCVLSQVGGGLSGAAVLRLRITDSGGAPIHDAIAKLGLPQDVRDEARRFDDFVVRLHPSATPRKLATLDFGASTEAGIFFGLAEGFTHSAFSIAATSLGGPSVQRVEAAVRRWVDGVPETRRTIADVRRKVLSDSDLATILTEFSIPWASWFEEREIQARWGCIHGDLHGENVLISEDGQVVLIDYGDVGEGPSALDPITLELSLLFHPQGALRGSGWPASEQARKWGDIENYTMDCPASDFVRACRSWAEKNGAGKREIAASAYAYLIRQLKYADTDKDLVLQLLEGVKSFFDAT